MPFCNLVKNLQLPSLPPSLALSPLSSSQNFSLGKGIIPQLCFHVKINFWEGGTNGTWENQWCHHPIITRG